MVFDIGECLVLDLVMLILLFKCMEVQGLVIWECVVSDEWQVVILFIVEGDKLCEQVVELFCEVLWVIELMVVELMVMKEELMVLCVCLYKNMGE